MTLTSELLLSPPRNFDEALRFSHEGVEDSLVNWLGLVAILAVGVVPIVVMQRNRTKPVKKRREVSRRSVAREVVRSSWTHRDGVGAVAVQALRSLTRNRLTAKSAKTFKQDFTTTRRQYVSDPLARASPVVFCESCRS